MQSEALEKSQSIEHHSADSRMDHKEHLDQPEHQMSRSESIQDAEVQPDITWRTWIPVIAALISYIASVFALVAASGNATAAIATLGEAEKKSWILNAPTIILASVGPITGLATDAFGRKWLLVAYCAFSFIGSIIAAKASSINMLIGGIILTSFGVTSLVIALVIPSEVLPRRWRPFAQSLSQLFCAIGGFTAFLSTGAFAKYDTSGEGWRNVFWVEAGLWALGVLAVTFGYNPKPFGTEIQRQSFGRKLMSLDPVGFVLWACCILPFLTGLNYGGSPYAWSDPIVVAPLCVGAGFLPIFAAWEWKGKKDGILNHKLFSRGRNFALALVIQAVEGFVFIAFIAFYPTETAILWESDPLLGEVRASIIFFCYFAASLFCGWYSVHFKRVKDTLLLGFIIFLGGAIGMATTKPSSGGAAIAYAVLVGVGSTVPVIQLVVIVQLSTPADLIGVASAIDLSVRGIGAALGGAVSGAVLTNKLASYIPDQVAAAALAKGVPPSALASIIGATAAGNATLLAEAAIAANIAPANIPALIGACFGALLNAFADAFRYVWIVSLSFLVLAIILIFLLTDLTKEMNYIVDHPIEKIHHHGHHDTEHVGHHETAKTDTVGASH